MPMVACNATDVQVFTPGENPDTAHYIPFTQRDSFPYTTVVVLTL